MQGVLLLIFANGDAYFYPLNDKTKGDSPTSARMITLESSNSRKFVRTPERYDPSKPSSARAGNDKYFVYDVALSLNPEFKVFTFPFEPKEKKSSSTASSSSASASASSSSASSSSSSKGQGGLSSSQKGKKRFRSPKKLLLSPNKRLLLIHGGIHRGQSSLLVYQILEDTTPYFRLIFYDMSFTFLDACFSPDSKSLVTIPSRYPCFIFLLNLNFVLNRAKGGMDVNQGATVIQTNRNGQATEQEKGAEKKGDEKEKEKVDNPTRVLENENVYLKKISFDPRVVGPLAIIGPATGAFGQPLRMTHIASSNNIRNSAAASPTVAATGNAVGGSSNNNAAAIVSNSNSSKTAKPAPQPKNQKGKTPEANTSGAGNAKPFHFVTWNDDGEGEYCLWTIIANRREKETIQYEWFPRLLFPKVLDKEWLVDEHTPKNYILDVQFSTKEGGRLLFLVRRENHGGNKDGIGIQMVKLTNKADSPKSKKTCWYQCTESMDRKYVLSVKWTNTLLLGSNCSAAVVIKGKGLFELVDYHFASAFQTLYDEFVRTACNFIQVGRYHRFWTDRDGRMNVMVVTPQQASSHPEWRDLFDQNSSAVQQQFLNMRHLGRRIGYFINDIRKDSNNVMEKLYAKERGKPKPPNPKNPSAPPEDVLVPGSGNIDAFFGMHLYRCWKCKRPLLKPLQCSRCQCVVYCSRTCQREDWATHKSLCDTAVDTYALQNIPPTTAPNKTT